MTDRLAISLCGIALQNPVIAASGTFGYGVEFEHIADLNAIGGLVGKSPSRQPLEGNAPPRIWEAAPGTIKSVGLPNIRRGALPRRKPAPPPAPRSPAI